MDEIDKEATVMFIGDYFALTTTVVLLEKFRKENEDDDTFAKRLAASFMSQHYEFHDLEKKSNSIGVIDVDRKI